MQSSNTQPPPGRTAPGLRGPAATGRKETQHHRPLPVEGAHLLGFSLEMAKVTDDQYAVHLEPKHGHSDPAPPGSYKGTESQRDSGGASGRGPQARLVSQLLPGPPHLKSAGVSPSRMLPFRLELLCLPPTDTLRGAAARSHRDTYVNAQPERGDSRSLAQGQQQQEQGRGTAPSGRRGGCGAGG